MVLPLLRREPVIPAGTTVDVIGIDGATASRFTIKVKRLLEAAETLAETS